MIMNNTNKMTNQTTTKTNRTTKPTNTNKSSKPSKPLRQIKLQSRLTDRGLSLRLLSRMSGVAYATVYNLLTGKKSVRDASAETVRKLSTALDMTMDEFYDALLQDDALLPDSALQTNTPNSSAEDTAPATTLPAPIRDFTLMWRDEPVADLMISNGKVLLERYTTNPAKQLFHADRISLFTLGEIMRTRCWDENRPDIQDLLRMIGLDAFDPYSIVSKTHGLMAQDPIWFRFKGEKLTYWEVRRINIATGNHD